MMEEEALHESEELLQITKDAVMKDQLISSETVNVGSVLNPGSCDPDSFRHFRAVDKPLESLSGETESVLVEKSKAFIIGTTTENSHATLTVLYASPSTSRHSSQKVCYLTTDPGGASFIVPDSVSFGRASMEINQVGTSKKFEQNLGDRSNIVISTADSDTSITNAKLQGSIESSPVSRGMAYAMLVDSLSAKTSVSEAVCDSNTSNNNNNNNVDKLDVTIVNMTRPANEMLHSDKSNSPPALVENVDTSLGLKTTTSRTLSPPDSYMVAGLFQRGRSGAGQGVHLINQSLPTASLSLGAPKLPVAVHSDISSATKATTSLAGIHSRAVLTSQTEPVKLSGAHIFIHGDSIHSIGDCSRTDRIATGLTKLPVIMSSGETASLNSCHDNGNKMAVNQVKSFASQSVKKCLDENSEHLNRIVPSENRTLTVQPDYSLPSKVTSSLSNANQHLCSGQKPLVVASLQPASKSLGSSTSSSIPAVDKDITKKIVKKPRNRNSKAKSPKTPPFVADDEDDDNDFIPVGMLQLSALKKSEGALGVSDDLRSAECSKGNHYQLNQGLSVRYEHQPQAGGDACHLLDKKPCLDSGNTTLQEILKQKMQKKLKPPPGDSHQLEAQQQEVERHRLLLQLVHTQQKKNHLQDQQQPWQQPVSSQNQAASSLTKTADFPKNQGLIIHHCQPQVHDVSSVQVKDYPVKSDQGGDRQATEEDYQSLEKSEGTEKLWKHQKEDGKYSQLVINSVVGSNQIQKDPPVKHQESLRQERSSNIPKIAERLFQQSANDQMLQQIKSDHMFLHFKTEDTLKHKQLHVSTSSSELTVSRPITPIAVSLQQGTSSLNQQHPEIARMLSSPVSPRQPASPRQSASPRRTLSPTQSLGSSGQFISPRKLVVPLPRQPSILSNPANSQSVLREQSISSLKSSVVKQIQKCEAGSQQAAVITHPSSLCVNTTYSQQLTGQSISVQLLTNQRPVRLNKVCDTEQYPFANNAQHTTADTKDATPSVSNSNDALLISPHATPVSESFGPVPVVESFGPIQVIHHRPPDFSSRQSRLLNSKKSQPPFSVQFPSPVKSPMPSAFTTATQSSKYLDPVPSHTNDVQRLPQQQQQVDQVSGQSQLHGSDVEHVEHNDTCQIHAKSRSSLGFSTSVQNVGQKTTEMQLYSSSAHFVQPVNTSVDAPSVNSFVMSNDLERHIQSIASLTEKETSFLQSLFANSSSVPSDDIPQTNVTQTSHLISHQPFTTSLETSNKCEDNLKKYTSAAAPLYSEMRKNEGGLKVLSEIASERYVLAVAGKDDQLCDQPNYHCVEKSRSDTFDTHDFIKASPINETLSLSDKTSSVTNKFSVLQKADNSARITDKVNEAKSTESNSLIGKEPKDSSLTKNETPRREVRQRKPKKPFEQDETPAKRSLKISPQKNISHKKQIMPTNITFHKKQGQKTVETKINENLLPEEMKQVFTRQTRLSSAENRGTKPENKDNFVEHDEITRLSENDASSRRLSKRLQGKEKEKEQNTDIEKSTRISRQSSRINYKEDASDSVDESVIARSASTSRHGSISSDDAVQFASPERMTTRSKIRNIDNKTKVTRGQNKDDHRQKMEISTEKKKLTNTLTTNTPKTKDFHNNENRRETRNTIKSAAQRSESQNPVRLDNTSFSTPRRMTTRQAVAELEKSGRNVKSKRLLPSVLVDEMLHLEKRVRKSETHKGVQDSSKQSDGKSENKKGSALKESLTAEKSEKDVSNTDTENIQVKRSRKKKPKNKRKRSRLKSAIAAGPGENIQMDESKPGECEEISTPKDHLEEAKPQGGVGSCGSQNDLEHASKDITKVNSKRMASCSVERTSNKIARSLNKENESEMKQDEKEESEDDKGLAADSLHVVTERVLTPEPKSKDDHSVTLSTFSATEDGKSLQKSMESLSTSVVTSSLLDDKRLHQTEHSSEKQTFRMYKLVPVLEEDAPAIPEAVVPFSGFFIPGGSADRIVVPHNFMQGPVTTMLSSSITLSSSSGLSSTPQIPTLSTSFASTTSEEPVHILPQEGNAKWASCVSIGTTSSPLPLCTTAATGYPSSVWTSPTNLPPVSSVSQSSITVVSSVPQSSTWTHQSPDTPPLSASEHLYVVPKKTWTSTSPRASTPRPVPSWNGTPSSLPSPSQLPMSSSSSSTWNSSTSIPVPWQQDHEQEQTWTRPAQPTTQESSWSSPPSVAALESWSKDLFPSTVYANTHRQPEATGPVQHNHSSTQNMLLPSGCRIGSSSPQQAQAYSSNADLGVHSGTIYNTGTCQESEFVDTRQETLIQGFLRHVVSNPGTFSQDLAGFNLGQQDLAYLETRLKPLSPNTLFSAVTAYDDASGQGNAISHDNSLQESINLVHTVNLDMEDGNLDLSDLGNPSRNLDKGQQEQIQPQVNAGGVEVQQDGKEAKNEIKKSIKERKSQYEIVSDNDRKNYKCLTCNKCFGVSTIYRHLRIHDPDYKSSCSLCGKQYAQKHSLMTHMEKCSGDKRPSFKLLKSPPYEGLSSSEQDIQSPVKSPDLDFFSQSSLKSPATVMKSLSETQQLQRLSFNSEPAVPGQDINQLSKKQTAHQQIEELRKLKAEKKLAAAQKKALDDTVTTQDCSTLKSVSPPEDDTLDQPMSSAAGCADFSKDRSELLSLTHEPHSFQKSPYQNLTGTTDFGTSSCRTPSHLPENYDNKIQETTKSQFQFCSPHHVVSKVPQFHVDNIPKPISTPVIKSVHSADSDLQKETAPDKVDDKIVCEICHTKLQSKSGYLLHLRRHNDVKTKFCSYCDKAFHTLQELRSHERTHTGEKPFKCDICHMAFAHSGSFVSHRKSHEKRGERQPFPVVDGQVQYPSTFKKPRLSGGVGTSKEKTAGVRKSKKKQQLESHGSEQLRENQSPAGQQASVIQKNILQTNLSEQMDSSQRDFSNNLHGRWQGLSEQRMTTDDFRSSMGSPALSNLGTSDVTMDATPNCPREQEHTEYVPLANNYSSAVGNTTSDYYSSQAGYSPSVPQREFLSPHTSSPSPHAYYKQDRYYPRSSSVDAFRSDSRSHTAPVNLAVEKNQEYSGSHSYSDSGQGSGSYYSPQQRSSDYQYNAPLQNEGTDYQQDDFDDPLSHYKSDPSSTEIVKKLLQHYNVPASTFQEAIPIDYSHQDTIDYSRHSSGSDYSNLGIGRSTPAPPPPYSASVSSLQKQYYTSHPSTPDYDSAMIQTSMVADQSMSSSQESQHLLQSHLLQDGQFGHSQGHRTDVYNSEDRFPSSQSYQESQFTTPALAQSADLSFHDTPFTSPSLIRPPSRSYPLIYRSGQSQPLPKIEILAREQVNSPSAETKSQGIL